MNRKYIIMGNGYGWCKYTHAIAGKLENVEYIDEYLPIKGSLKKIIVHLHYSNTLNKCCNLPLKRVWYNDFFKNIGLNDNDDIVLIIYDNNKLCNDVDFLQTLRKKYPRIVLVYMFTNIVAKSRAIENDFVPELKMYYDIVFAFDRMDAEKYGFYYSPLVYSPDICRKTKGNTKKHERVFYIGNAKDRIDMLHAVYERIESLGVECKFFIVGVPEEKQIHKGNITYNKMIPYEIVLDYIQDSTCLLDVIQGESTGLTIKVCEAIYFNKKLITTNKDIENYDFYDQRFIKVIDSAEDLNDEFFTQDSNVEYKESGREYFSLAALLKRIDYAIDNGCRNQDEVR